MRLLTTALVVSLVTVTGAQVDPAPAFEVVSVRLNQSNPPMQVLPMLQQGGRVFAINLPLREFIRVAYGLQDTNSSSIRRWPTCDSIWRREQASVPTANRQ